MDNSVNTKKRQMPYWLCAFIVSLLTAAAAIVPILIKNHGYMAMSHDFSAEEISYNILMNKAVKSGEILWNWGIDLGSNFIETFSFYGLGSPFVWITLLFPASMVPLLMGPMMILKFAVAGTIASVYFNRHIKNRTLVILASVLYAFSGFQCSSVVFYHFQDPVAFFPLLLIGLEKLMEEKKHGFLVLGVAVNALCNYVFFFAEVMFIVIFYIVKYMIPRIEQLRSENGKHNASGIIRQILSPILSCCVEGIIGVAIAGILFVPSIYGTMSNSRISNHLPSTEWFSMSTVQWLQLIKAFYLPGETMNANLSVSYSDWMTNSAYIPLFGAVFALTYAMTKKDWLSRMLKVSMVCAIIPVLNNMFSFLSGEEYRRWYFMFILLMVLATAKVIENRDEFRLKKPVIISAILFVMLMIMIFINQKTLGDNGIYKNELFVLSALLGIAGPVAAVTLPAITGGRRKLTYRLYVALAVFISACTLGTTIKDYQTATDNSTLDFKTYGATYGENVYAYLTEIPAQLEKDVLPYRYYFDEGIGYTYYNIAMTEMLPSINSFCSTVHSSISEYYDSIGLLRATWTPAGPGGIRELLGAKYVVSLIDQPIYTYIGECNTSTGQTLKLYENDNALPLGFTYDIYVTRSYFDTLDDWIKPTAMLKMLVIEDDDEPIVSQYLRKYDPYVDGAILYDEVYDIAREHLSECSENFDYGKNYFSSTITSDGEKYAFYAVPYDKAWHAQVNGEEVQILNINGLMGIKINQGVNEIKFDYVYKPLKYGIVLSIFGIIAWIIYVFMCRRLGTVRSFKK